MLMQNIYRKSEIPEHLQKYFCPAELGLEATPEEYVANMVKVFTEVWRVLKPEGTLWVNIGDTYYGGKGSNGASKAYTNYESTLNKKALIATAPGEMRPNDRKIEGLKQKDLVGIPWMLAFALRSAGWYLRQDIIWSKPNPMPESVTDRCTKSHEYIFLLSKSPKYYYDQDAIKEPAIYDVDGTGTAARKARVKSENKSLPTNDRNGIRPAGFKDAKKMNGKHSDKQRGHPRRHNGFNDRWDNMSVEEQCTGMRNKRDVWTVATARYSEAHFATFPPELITPCVLAGCPPGGLVLDPFMGAGTTALVAAKTGRNYAGFELNPEYIKIAENRLRSELGMFYQHKNPGELPG